MSETNYLTTETMPRLVKVVDGELLDHLDKLDRNENRRVS